MLFGCSLNGPINIPAHTCAHGNFAQPGSDFVKDLRRYYSLSPGTYFVVPSARTAGPAPRLTVTITRRVVKRVPHDQRKRRAARLSWG